MALLVAVTCAAMLAGLSERPPVPYWVAGAAGIAALAALGFDAYGGIAAGIGAAVGLVALRRATGHWDPDDFTPALAEVLAICAAGAVAGFTGTRLRDTGSPAGPSRTGALRPAYGSLGLIGQDAAMVRLDEEVQRATAHRRPLSLVLFDLQVKSRSLPEGGRPAALRAVARIVESQVGESDVPFALAPDRIGVVLPETGVVRAWELVAEILHGVSEARFTYGAQRTRWELAESVEIQAGLAQHSGSTGSGRALLDAAVEAARRSRLKEPVR